jgi:hypothetical protein
LQDAAKKEKAKKDKDSGKKSKSASKKRKSTDGPASKKPKVEAVASDMILIQCILARNMYVCCTVRGRKQR